MRRNVLSGKAGQKPEILSHIVFSQIKEHSPYGGVVPEIARARRAYASFIKANDGRGEIEYVDLSAVAATYAWINWVLLWV